MSAPRQVPFHRPSIGQAEIDEAVAAMRSGWLTAGPRTEQFEREFGAYVQSPHALAVNSGTSAMHLALTALGLQPGDEVITSPLTFCSTVHVIIQAGGVPVLADVDGDGNIDPESVRQRITPATKGLLPVHLGGVPCNMDELWSIARQHNLFVVEDAAHAAGSRYRGRPIGAADPERKCHSAAVAFSFYATKNIATGEGGMVVTPDESLAAKMKLLSLHGITRDIWNRTSWQYEVIAGGFKYNFNDVQAAIGIHQLRKLDRAIQVRRRLAEAYRRLLAGVEELELPGSSSDAGSTWHLFAGRLRLDVLKIDRDAFIEKLKERGVEASVHFIPVPLHPYFEFLARDPRNHCPQAMELYRRLVSLPLYPAMTEEDIGYVSNAIKTVIGQARNRNSVAAGT